MIKNIYVDIPNKVITKVVLQNGQIFVTVSITTVANVSISIG